MIRSFRVFNYSGTALALPAVDIRDIGLVFRSNRQIKRIEVYERNEDETIWQGRFVKAYYAKEFK